MISYYKALLFFICFSALAYVAKPFFIASPGNLHEKEPIEFVVVVPSYNNERFCIKNMKSIVEQAYPHFHLYYIDDASTDRTGKLVDEFVAARGLETRCTIVHNKTRKGALANLYEAIHKTAPHKVIVTVDGDDFLAHSQVLDILATVYADKNVWLTYGDFKSAPAGWETCADFIPFYVSNTRSFRSYKWVSTHLRTFYAKLFHLIKKEDLMQDGTFFAMTWDMGFMFPMLEMASKWHFRYIPDTLYIYNVANPINDYLVNAQLQRDLDQYIRNLPPYEAVDKLF